MKMVYEGYENIHPMIRAVLSHNTYNIDDRENLISVTSIMKPVNMIALERSNNGAMRKMNIQGMIPSVFGTSIHDKAEKAIEDMDDEKWKALGIPKPETLEILQENRMEMEVGDFILSGQYDLLFRYNGSQWQLGDWKSMSVWGLLIDLPGKKEEWSKQMSLYRYLNQDKEIDDLGLILYWLTDWSKTDARSKAKSGYPPMRVGQYEVPLWSIPITEKYLLSKASKITNAMNQYKKTGSTGVVCSGKELWEKPEGYAYYTKSSSKRATKVYDNFSDADDARLAAKDPTAYVEHRQGQKTRCAYCSVLEFCDQGQGYKVLGLVPEL